MYFPEMDQKFSPGDSVKDKRSGRVMNVRYYINSYHVMCSWNDDSGLYKDSYFHEDHLDINITE